jgi:hypothetical protein
MSWWPIGAGLLAIALFILYTIRINRQAKQHQNDVAQTRPNLSESAFVAALNETGADPEVAAMVYRDMRALCRGSKLLPHPDDPFSPLYIDDPEDLTDYAEAWMHAFAIPADDSDAFSPWSTLRDAIADLSDGARRYVSTSA